jgi:hypothetical protein
MSWYQQFERLKSIPRLAEVLAALGGTVGIILSWFYAHTKVSNLDEGAYLLKGYLFATGKYWPFQDYGPWTNHMPLSFLIPGWVQVVFGPGLRTGRYLTIALFALMLIGVWVIASRLGNRWWAAALVWLLAMNLPVIQVYSIVASQGLVACILTWVLVLVLGPERPLWQVVFGSMLAGLLLLTRLNMSPVLPLVLVYVFWEHGKKTGLWTLFLGTLIVGVGHAVFWPGIMELWDKWLPVKILPFLNTVNNDIGIKNSIPDIKIQSRILSLFLGMRTHFFPVIGVYLSLFMWPQRRKWRSEWRFRVAVFLAVSFSILFALHAWASLGKNYCVFCFPNYLMFFQILGILFVCVVFNSWSAFKERFGKWTLSVTMLGVALAMEYSLVKIEGKKINNSWFVRNLWIYVRKFWRIEIPRIKSMRIQPGRVKLWGLFENRFGWSEEQIIIESADILRKVLPIILELLIIGLVLYFGAKWYQRLQERGNKVLFSPMAGFVMMFFSLGTLITLGIGFLPHDSVCGWDVISSYEAGGAHIAEVIPSGSKIYWRGGLSPVPLLYLTDYEIYPPQLNDGYSYRRGGDPDELVRRGWWNEELKEQWLLDADIILVEGDHNELDKDIYEEISSTLPMLPCNDKSEIHIYKRK